jgi:Putative zinc-finger
MDCKDAECLIDESLNGALSAEGVQRLEAHLAGCLACRRLERDLASLTDGLARLPAVHVSEQAWRAAVAAAVRGRPLAARWWLVPALGVAAAAVVAMVLWWPHRAPAPPPGPGGGPMVAAGPSLPTSPNALPAHPPRRAAQSALRPTQRGLPPSRHRVRAPAPAAPVPASEGPRLAPPLTGEDVALIYEQGLRFAQVDGGPRALSESVIAARQCATAGDVAGAVRRYEEAVRLSMGAPPEPPAGPRTVSASLPAPVQPVAAEVRLARLPPEVALVDPIMLAEGWHQ